VSGHVADRLSPFLDDELDAREREAVVRHLQECSECTRHLQELSAVDRLAGAEPVPVPDGYFNDFVSRVRSRIRHDPAAARPRLVVPGWVMGLAAGLVIALVAPLIVRQKPVASLPESERVAQAPAAAPPATLPPATTLAAADVDSLKSLGYVQGPSDDRRDQPASGGRAAALANQAPQRPPQAPAPAPPPATLQDRKKKAEVAASAPPEPAALREELSVAAEGQEREAAKSPDAFQEQDAEEAKRDDAGRLGAAARDRAVKAKQAAPPAPQAADSTAFASAPAENAAAAPAAVPKLQKSGPSPAFRALVQRQAGTIAEARGLREAWRAFAGGALGSEADEARVRVIEGGAVAYRLSGESADLELFRRDAANYLRREDAAQKDRVRGLLASVR